MFIKQGGQTPPVLLLQFGCRKLSCEFNVLSSDEIYGTLLTSARSMLMLASIAAALLSGAASDNTITPAVYQLMDGKDTQGVIVLNQPLHGSSLPLAPCPCSPRQRTDN